MADAWGGSWGLAWGDSWGAGVAPPLVPDLDRHDGYRRQEVDEGEIGERHRRRERERQSERERLRKSVETAFRRVLGEEEEAPVPVPLSRPATRKELKRLAVVVREDIRLDGMDATLKDIQGLLSELQTGFVAERERRLREDEALLVLMLSA